MADVDGTLILDILGKMQAQFSCIQPKLGDVEGRLAGLKEASSSMSARIVSLEVTVSGTRKRIDRMEHRLDRIETRLGLVDA